jgi:ABC-2 type transport system permease protein
VKAYLTVLSARMRQLLQYRVAAVAGFGTQLFWGLIRMMIFVAFYESAAGRSLPMTQDQTVTYIWLGQAFLLLVMLSVDPQVEQMITSGNVVYELLRPVHLYLFWFSRVLASRIVPVLLRAGPLLLIVSFATFDGRPWIHWPDWPGLACAAVSLAATTLLSSAMGLIMTIAMFWTMAGFGVNRVVWAAAYLLGGLIIPVPLFPDSWQAVMNFLPFRGLADVPFRFFVGSLPPSALPAMLVHQLGWTLAIGALGHWMLWRGLKRMVVQGG